MGWINGASTQQNLVDLLYPAVEECLQHLLSQSAARHAAEMEKKAAIDPESK